MTCISCIGLFKASSAPAIGLCFSLARKNDRHQHTAQACRNLGRRRVDDSKQIRDALKALTEVFLKWATYLNTGPTRMTWEVNIPALLAKAEEDQNLNTLN